MDICRRGYADFFLELNLLPHYSLCSQGDKFSFLFYHSNEFHEITSNRLLSEILKAPKCFLRTLLKTLAKNRKC